MIMSRLLQKPRVKILLLCACFGLAMSVAGCGSREERAQAYYERGKEYLEKKDYVKARIEFRNAIQRKADLLPAWQALARIDEQEQNLAGLAGTLRRITELAPNDLEATIRLARLYLLAGGNVLDQALKLANKAGEIDPKNTDALALKAAILLKLQDSDGAARAAQEALAIDPQHTGANVVAAGVKLSQGDADGALKALASVSKDHANDLAVLFLKINIFSRKGDLPQVEAGLRKLTELYPTVPRFRSQLVQFYLQNKRQDDALNTLRSVVAANPGDTNAELDLVNLLAAVKGPAAARDELVARIQCRQGRISLPDCARKVRPRAGQDR